MGSQAASDQEAHPVHSCYEAATEAQALRHSGCVKPIQFSIPLSGEGLADIVDFDDFPEDEQKETRQNRLALCDFPGFFKRLLDNFAAQSCE